MGASEDNWTECRIFYLIYLKPTYVGHALVQILVLLDFPSGHCDLTCTVTQRIRHSLVIILSLFGEVQEEYYYCI